MTDKQKRFCEEYIIDCNATQAAIRAGYSEATANEAGSRLLANVNIRAYIDELLADMKKSSIASAEDVLEYLTSVMRGQNESEIVVVLGKGEGLSVAERMSKKPAETDRLKAAELLGKRYALWTDRTAVTSDKDLHISIDYGDEPQDGDAD